MLKVKQAKVDGLVLLCINAAWEEEKKTTNLSDKDRLDSVFVQVKDHGKEFYVRFVKKRDMKPNDLQGIGRWQHCA